VKIGCTYGENMIEIEGGGNLKHGYIVHRTLVTEGPVACKTELNNVWSRVRGK
jgi:hypothetical protein